MSKQYSNLSDTDSLMKNQHNISSSSASGVTAMDIEVDSLEKEAQRKKASRAAFLKQFWMFFLMIFIDIGLPFAIYYILKEVVGQLIALLLSGIPPLLHVIINFIRKRRIEVVGCVCIFSFILSAILTLISGNARVALLRDSTTTSVIAVAFLITLIPLRTPWFTLYPLTFLVYRQMTDELAPMEWTDYDGQHQSLPVAEFYWAHCRGFRIHHYVLTATWGVALIGEFIAKVIMIEATSLSVDDIMVYGTIIMGSLVGTIAIATSVTSHIFRKRYIVVGEEWLKANDYSSKYSPQQV